MRFLAWLNQCIQPAELAMSGIQCSGPESDGKPDVFAIVYLGNLDLH